MQGVQSAFHHVVCCWCCCCSNCCCCCSMLGCCLNCCWLRGPRWSAPPGPYHSAWYGGSLVAQCCFLCSSCPQLCPPNQVEVGPKVHNKRCISKTENLVDGNILFIEFEMIWEAMKRDWLKWHTGTRELFDTTGVTGRHVTGSKLVSIKKVIYEKRCIFYEICSY